MGIGVTNPAANLHIKYLGSVEVKLESDSNNSNEAYQPRITFSQDGGGVRGKIGYFDSSNNFKIMNESGGGNILIRDNGFIGIGTSQPIANFHVSGGSSSAVLLVEADKNNSGEQNQPRITLSQDGGSIKGSLGYFDSNNDLKLVNESGGASIILKQNGEVCIGYCD